MFLKALATDYDGTLATEGITTPSTIAAMEKLRESGRKIILVTGRELPDMRTVYDRFDLFDAAVMENGGLLYFPETGEERPLTPAPDPEFVRRLVARGVGPISVGRSIVATWEPHQDAVLETIKEMGLDLQIIFNKGAVMILPSGVNKATGLAAALDALELSEHNVVGVGDAENDHAFLRACGCSAAVGNALPAVKDTADFVTTAKRGAGVEQLIAEMLANDEGLAALPRNRVQFGIGPDGEAADLKPTDVLLVAGSSGIGKSTFATALTERLAERKLQFCVLDPEGDYTELVDAVDIGDRKLPPSLANAMELLQDPDENLVVNTLGLELHERPAFFAEFLAELGKLRSRTARPHWIIADEAHHLLPLARTDNSSNATLPSSGGVVLVTVHPQAIAAEVLQRVTKLVALGPEADKVIAAFCAAVGDAVPDALTAPDDDRVLYWHRASGSAPKLVTVEKPRQVHQRHIRKYAEGALDDTEAFYFRGPEGRLNLKAQNLILFLQLAEGVDDDTWIHHLEQGDYSAWFRSAIKDTELAAEAEQIEQADAPPAQSRRRIAEIVSARYTLPAQAQN